LFADPTIITVNAVPISMNRTGSTENGGRYASADRAYRLELNHQYGRRVRHQIKLSHDLYVASPIITGNNVANSVSTYLVVDHPVGFSVVDMKKDVDGFIDLLDASTGALVTKLLGGES
jgi:hypothetical protein